MPHLRPSRFLLALLVLSPAAAYAAPASPPAHAPPASGHAAHAPAHASHAAAAGASAKKTTALTTAKAGAPAKPAAASALKTVSHHGATARLAPAAGPQRAAPARSVGSPTEGHLVGGAHLADAPYLRIYPVYAGADVRWGLDSLVGLIDRAGKSVRKQFPDAVLSVGHLSKAGGGELDRHASHESGRDADIGFYVKNAAGKPVYGDHMVAFTGDGTAPSWPGAHFDDARNWALVAAILGDGHARVTHMFVATPIRQRLLAYATKIGASPAIRSRAAEVLVQPHGALPHDDHFHVRIACPSGMEKCVELPTAKNRSRHGGAVASHGHAGHPSSNAAPSHAGASHAGATAAAPGAKPASPGAKPAAPTGKPASPPPVTKPSAQDQEEAAKSDSLIPSLAPAVPGLDSAVIPAPLGGVRSTWGIGKDEPAAAAPAPKADPISDPDGVLEGR